MFKRYLTLAAAGTTAVAVVGCAGPRQARVVPLVGLDGDIIENAPTTIVHTTTVTTTEVMEPVDVTTQVAEIIPGNPGAMVSTPVKKSVCNPKGIWKHRVGKTDPKVVMKEVVVKTPVGPKKTTTITTTQSETFPGGKMTIGTNVENNDAFDPQTLVVWQKPTAIGALNTAVVAQIVTEDSALKQVGGFIADLGTLGLGVGASLYAARYQPDQTNVTATGGDGGNAESNSKANAEAEAEAKNHNDINIKNKNNNRNDNRNDNKGHGKKDHKGHGNGHDKSRGKGHEKHSMLFKIHDHTTGQTLVAFIPANRSLTLG